MGWIGIALAVIGVAVSTSCAGATDVSAQKPYSEIIGRIYRVVGAVAAYSVRGDVNDKEPSYVTLRPVGFSGSEYVSTVRVTKGTTFRVVAARRTFMLFDDGTKYVVEIEHAGIPKGLEMSIPLLGENEGRDGDLNPAFFEPVPK